LVEVPEVKRSQVYFRRSLLPFWREIIKGDIDEAARKIIEYPAALINWKKFIKLEDGKIKKKEEIGEALKRIRQAMETAMPEIIKMMRSRGKSDEEIENTLSNIVLERKEMLDNKIKELKRSGEAKKIEKKLAPKLIRGVDTLDSSIDPGVVEEAIETISTTASNDSKSTEQKLKDIWTILSFFKLPKEEEEKLERTFAEVRPTILNLMSKDANEIAELIANNPNSIIAKNFRQVISIMEGTKVKTQVYKQIINNLYLTAKEKYPDELKEEVMVKMLDDFKRDEKGKHIRVEGKKVPIYETKLEIKPPGTHAERVKFILDTLLKSKVSP
jgi:hypothetical protein